MSGRLITGVLDMTKIVYKPGTFSPEIGKSLIGMEVSSYPKVPYVGGCDTYRVPAEKISAYLTGDVFTKFEGVIKEICLANNVTRGEIIFDIPVSCTGN